LAAGDLSTAHALLEELERIGRSKHEYARIITDAVRTALGLRDLELAQRLAEGLPSEPLFRGAAVLTARALIAEHESRVAEAERGFSDAAQRWRELEVPWEHAQALLGQARCLIAVGRSHEATEPLGVARDIFRSLAATPALADTNALLQRASAIVS
jgi:hypothetical protein